MDLGVLFTPRNSTEVVSMSNDGNIQISSEHYTALVCLAKRVLRLKHESEAKAIIWKIIGDAEDAVYRDLQSIDGISTEKVAERLEITVPIARCNDFAKAAVLVGSSVSVCPKCHEFAIDNRGGTWVVLNEGVCPGGCGTLLKQVNVQTERFSWVTGTMIAADIIADDSLDASTPVPLTEEGIRRQMMISAQIDRSISAENGSLIDLCHGLLHHPDYSPRFSNPFQVLLALEDPRGKGGLLSEAAVQLAVRRTKGWRVSTDSSRTETAPQRNRSPNALEILGSKIVPTRFTGGPTGNSAPFRRVLLSVFSSYEEVARFVKENFDKNLQTIVSSSQSFEMVLFELIEYANRGHTGLGPDRLIRFVCQAYPENADLVKFVQTLPDQPKLAPR